ncbi:MFS general substrate transporter [Boletus reticuloceps]|uniref:Autophagy-related protein n=1 Tax=Boletus reticuloceps TaxID=495285 RepID=A0A8I2YKY1_9AGAM|nr:MFS general substrate transporter [Boletus reticuloceps]
MSLVSTPEHPVHFVDATDVKDNDDSPGKGNTKSTVLIATLQEDEPVVTRRELWSYYLYYNGDNGVGPLGYTQTLFQSLATAAGYDPVAGPGSSCLSDTASGQCVLPWLGGTKSVSSIVLISNGMSFAIMTAIFTTIGSAADYGNFGRWLLFSVTVVCWIAQYACMALTCTCRLGVSILACIKQRCLAPSRWKLAMALYIIGFVSYGATLVFYAAIFPRLARNTQRSRSLREKYENGHISVEEYEREESLEKNRISNISTVGPRIYLTRDRMLIVMHQMHSNIGYVVTYLLNLALLLPPKTANDPKVDNYTLALDNSYWVLLGVWWFIYQSPRPGPPLPKGESYLTVGWKQIWAALKTYKHLPYTFVYLFAFFLLADGLNTTGTLVSICQNDKFRFSFLQNTYLGLSQAITSTISTLGFWYIQRYWKISTKKMFVVTNVVTILIPLWGMVGVWTDKFGAYNVLFGLFQAPYYAFSQTMMAELSPPGFDNMFFGLFGLSNRASSTVGPYVVQAIIDKTQDNWRGFPFLFAICTAASLVIWFGVDVKKGRRDAFLMTSRSVGARYEYFQILCGSSFNIHGVIQHE